MPEYGFSLTCIFPYKNRILGSVLIRYDHYIKYGRIRVFTEPYSPA